MGEAAPFGNTSGRVDCAYPYSQTATVQEIMESNTKIETCRQPFCPNPRFEKHTTCAVHTNGSHHVPFHLIEATVEAMDQHYRTHTIREQNDGYTEVSPQSSLHGLQAIFPKR